jgi:hypothetical protein
LRRTIPIFSALGSLVCSSDTENPPVQFADNLIETQSILWLESGSQEDGWGRGLLLFSDQELACESLPREAPGLRSLWRNEPIQGDGNGLLIWLQWTDLDHEIESWEGRYIVGEAPVGDRAQRRAVMVPYEDGIPQLDRPGRHGGVEILSSSSDELRFEIRSNEVEGSFVATPCAH